MQYDLFDDTARTVLEADTYERFRERLSASGCRLCPLSEGRTHIVVDRGNPASRLMFVGEGPGEQADLQGRAFVGKAGQLLDKILAAIGLDPDRDTLIVNVVKCRPPGNRAPHAEEAEACLPYLRRQIDLVRPEVIALLGATALRHFDPARKKVSMQQEAGRFFALPSFPGVDFVVLYHPAALLYDASLKPQMWRHVRLLRDHLARRRSA